MNTAISSTNLPLFLVSTLLLALTPGPVVLYIIARSVDQGRKAGLVSALSAALGDSCHVVFAALGLSTILLSSALAFDVVKYLGAGYLIYLGLRKITAKGEAAQTADPTPHDARRIFQQGLMVSVFNPKTALFFFAYLPQFVDRTQNTIPLQILLLGMIFVGMAATTNTCYALLSGTAGGWLKGNLKGNQRFMRAQRYVTGSIFIGLGVTAAFASSGKK